MSATTDVDETTVALTTPTGRLNTRFVREADEELVGALAIIPPHGARNRH